MITRALIQCPLCGYKKEEEMPIGFSETSYTCANCHRTIRVGEAECCVFCAHSDQFCPPKQEKRYGCCS